MLNREATRALIAKRDPFFTYLTDDTASLVFSPFGGGVASLRRRRVRSIPGLFSLQRVPGSQYQLGRVSPDTSTYGVDGMGFEAGSALSNVQWSK